MRKLGLQYDESKSFLELAATRSDEVVANMIIVLIHQADVLIRQYYNWNYEKFLKEGGYREKLTRERLAHRKDE